MKMPHNFMVGKLLLWQLYTNSFLKYPLFRRYKPGYEYHFMHLFHVCVLTKAHPLYSHPLSFAL